MPAFPPTSRRRLGALLAAAQRSGYPIRVALIASATDLGSVTELWRQPQNYARFLGQELSLVYRGPLLVVMPNGYGLYRLAGPLAPNNPRSPASPPRPNLATATLSAIQRLASASGHNLPLPNATAPTNPSSTDTVPWIVFADEVRKLALEQRPRIIVVGASAYSRVIDFKTFSEIAKESGAYLMADIAHIAGLIAAGQHPSPVPYADFVTTTTHKTLRGPRGGMIMCRAEFAKAVDKMIFPGIQGGPLVHVIAAKAVALKEAMSEDFRAYQRGVIDNARTLASELVKKGFRIISGGTDNHLMLVDLTSKGITGRDAEQALDKAGITVNKNAIPYDERPPAVTSGMRLGTPSVTTRGMEQRR